MTDWPRSIPPDLQRRLDEVISFRSFNSQEVWGVIREWLEKHQVEAPEGLPDEPKLDSHRG